MAQFPTTFYLSLGDGLVFNATIDDFIPSSGDYLQLSPAPAASKRDRGAGRHCHPDVQRGDPPKVSGAMLRMRSARAMPIKVITLTLTLTGGGTDATTVATWRVTSRRARASGSASGALRQRHLRSPPRAVRDQRSEQPTRQLLFSLPNVLGGVPTDQDMQVNPASAYGMSLQLRCLPYGRGKTRTWPGINKFTPTLVTSTTAASLFVGNTAPAWPGQTTTSSSVCYPRLDLPSPRSR